MGDKLLQKLNIYGKPIANKYYEGKVKRTLKRGLKDLKSLSRKRMKSNHCEPWSSLCWLTGENNTSKVVQALRPHFLLTVCRDRMNLLGRNNPWDAAAYSSSREKTVGGVEDPSRRFCQDDFIRPVLKHGPRSLTYMQVIGWKNPIA